MRFTVAARKLRTTRGAVAIAELAILALAVAAFGGTRARKNTGIAIFRM